MRARPDRLFAWTLPVAVLVLLAGIALTVLWASASRAAALPPDREPTAAETIYARQRALTGLWPESWKAPYNQGTAQLVQAEWEEAREALTVALERVPRAPAGPDGGADPRSPECAVRRNLALALGGLALQARAVGDEAGATALAEEATAVAAPCVGAQDEQPTPSPSPSPPPSPSADPRVEELEERNQRAREEAEQDLLEGGGGGGQNW